MTRSPGFSPSSMIQRAPACLPVLTVRRLTRLSAPTTATWYCPWVSSTAFCGTSSASRLDVGGDADFRVQTGTQNVVGIRESSLDHNRAGLHIDLPIGDVEMTWILVGLPSARIISSTGSLFLTPFSSCRLIRSAKCRYSRSLIGKVTLIGSSCETVVSSVVGPDQVADLRLGDSGDAIDGRVHLRPLQVEPRRLDRRLRRLDLRPRSRAWSGSGYRTPGCEITAAL